jgi:hypothetical protein
MKLMPTTSHAGLIDNVRKSGHKYTQGVQIACVQAVGHMLATGDTIFASKLLDTFGDGSVGKATFVRYMEVHGGMEYCGKKGKVPARFKINAEARAKLPPSDDVEGIEEYLDKINAILWTKAKPEAVVSMYDVAEAVDAMLKKAQREVAAGKEVAHAGLLQHLNLAVAAYHREAFDAGK